MHSFLKTVHLVTVGMAALCVGLAEATPVAYVGSVRPILDATRDIAITADGAHVYAAGPVAQGISILSRDPLTGALTNVGEISSGTFPVFWDVVVSADGKHVYATDEGVVQFDRDSGTGLLTFADSTGSFSSLFAALSPDDKHLYVGDFFGNSLVAYSRDAGTGDLTFLAGYTDGVSGVEGLDTPWEVLVSPDGNNVYVAGAGDDAVAVLSRDSVTGELTFVEAQVDGQGGVDGLLGPTFLALDPGGDHLYVSAEEGVVVFERDSGTGALTFVEYEDQSANFGATIRGIAVDLAGDHVYQAMDGPIPSTSALGALAVYERDSITGELTLGQVLSHGVAGTDLDGVEFLLLSPDGRHIYLSAEASTIATLQHTAVECASAPLGGCFQPTLPGAAKLLIKNDAFDPKDKVVSKWVRGEEVVLGDFADPASMLTDYALCLYDLGSPGGSLVFEGVAAAGGGCGKASTGGGTPCWKAKSTKGFGYKSKTRNPHGLVAMKLLAGAAGKAKVIAKGKGEALPTPALPLTGPVEAQVQNVNGTCWAATYSTPTVNDGLLYKAKSD
jgi:6-phosphogluconolactonase (cycloisomerase 2 family)